jgi:hypothetical protein
MELLRPGSKGPLVEYLQRKLISLNYTLAITGEFDDGTLAAVRDFQSNSKLIADGIVGGKTWTNLYLATTHTGIVESPLEIHRDIGTLHPVVRSAVVKVLVQVQAEGIPFRIFEAYRYPQRQAKLYAQGRTAPGSIVTYARPWLSYHQYGLAVDFVLFINQDWSWDDSGAKAAWWKRLHVIGSAEGLMRLGFEVPHLQLAGTSINALSHGVYPAGGDKAWYDNFMLARGQTTNS